MEDRMNTRFRLWSAFAAAVGVCALLSGPALAQAPSEQNPGPGAGAPDQGAQTGVQLPVLYVTSIEVLRTTLEPHLDIVRVRGLASSKGWSSPLLVPLFVGKPLDDILDLQLIASSPDASQKADGFVPISAVFELAPDNPFKGVRVRAAENALEVTKIPGTAHTEIKVNDCKDCIGKKFAEAGKAQPGAQGVVRREDLPRGEAMVRWLPPTRGVRGITHNPNRLNLVLGADNTIVEAFWE
jgi:hypothetical protein